ncbi:unnamed protein product, partial [Onchocerca ochengi]|uniref:ShKT domain-containing protein n=1 Tax=Onchocerca ochengi TaxID=42157 RepID=A0A182E3Z5_ONCOC
PTDECTDKSWRCVIWSLSIFDYCSSKTIANEICPKSCGTCYAQLVNKPTTTTTKSRLKSMLIGSPSEFTSNINMNIGEIWHLTITSTAAPTTTSKDKFESTTTICRDLDYSCPVLVRITGCDDFFPNYSMKTICPLSCGLCSNNDNDNDNNNNNNKNKKNNVISDKNNNKTLKKPEKICEDRGSYLTCKLALFFDECDEKVNLCAKTCNAC